MVLHEARRGGKKAIEILESEYGRFEDSLARLIGFDRLRLADVKEVEPDFAVLEYAECLAHCCLVSKANDGISIVVADPFDLDLRTRLEGLGLPTRWSLAERNDLLVVLAAHEGKLKAGRVFQADTEATDDESTRQGDVSLASIAAEGSPVIRFVNSSIYDAMQAGASDVHLECDGHGIEVKYRIDGVLASVARAPTVAFADQVISRLKVMAELDIAERRIPQDGRFMLPVRGHRTDFRVSVMPNAYGEDVVIRILDKRHLTDQFENLRLERLGFEGPILLSLRKLARDPYGMLLVTGPTGSGKTTTLYAALSEINSGREKIVTIEDPVEYQIHGILQIPVNEKKGLTFARGLRSILRHDPDRILVGEIRDSETAEIAIQSALTGHLVLTTVHANSVFDVLGRFVHMGVDLPSFASALNGIVAQRLVRLVCESCSIEASPTASELSESGIRQDEAPSMTFRSGRGCDQCRGTGYRGRSAIAELLQMNDEIRDLLVNRIGIQAVKEAARNQGFRSLRQSALSLVGQGRTTLEEANRVTFAA